jgi:beta-phosphoglucomutase-like phosphatase (HAD superfamily)
VTSPKAIVFDFDGVIADSELIANRTLAESLSAIGLPTTIDDCLRDYCGHNWHETERRIVARLGAPLPDGFRAEHRARSRLRFADDLAEVAGAGEFLERTAGRPRAIASSSSVEWLGHALGQMGLAHHFGEHLYSAEGLARGKPHPDIYLAAANGLGVAPRECLAIEDSPVGARSAVAAGMTVVGLVAGGHIADRTAHAAQLRAVGVDRIAFAFADIEA